MNDLLHYRVLKCIVCNNCTIKTHHASEIKFAICMTSSTLEMYKVIVFQHDTEARRAGAAPPVLPVLLVYRVAASVA